MKLWSSLRWSATFGVLFGTFCTAHAATYTVSNKNDSGSGSLRAAIDKANANANADTIAFSSGAKGTITFTRGELTLSSDITFQGPGASALTLSGGGKQRLFNITKGNVTLKNLTLSNGLVAGKAGALDANKVAQRGEDAVGGCLFNTGNLTLSSVTLSNNSAVGGDGADGPHLGLSLGGRLTGAAGGDARGGAIFNVGTLTLLQTTFTNNKAMGGNGGNGGTSFDMMNGHAGSGGRGGDAYGGALFNGGILTEGSKVSPSGSRFGANSAVGGAGGTGATAGTEMGPVHGSDGANGQSYSNDIRDVMPTAQDATFSGAQEQGFSGQLVGTGDTLTYTLTSGGLPEGLSLDPVTGLISGTTTAVGNFTAGYRVSDGYRTSSEATIHITIQASNPKSLVVDTNSDAWDNLDGKNTLREAVAYANTLSKHCTITFQLGTHSPTIQLIGSAIAFTGDISLVWTGTTPLTLKADTRSVISVASGAKVTLSGLQITGNSTSGEGIYNEGTLQLLDSTVRNNTSISGWGGGISNKGTLSITRCTISSNKCPNWGGGIYSSGTLKILNSTLAGNTAGFEGGGGLFNDGGTVNLDSCTVTANSAARGSAFWGYGGTITAKNCIIAGNKGDVANAADTKNLVVATAGAAGLETDSHGKALLKYNGGPTPTIALIQGSPAIDTGATSLRNDQRGLPRPVGTRPDFGATEFQDTIPVSDQTPPDVTVATPKEGQNIALSSFNSVAGSASDDVGVAEVWVTFSRTKNGVTLYWDGTAFTNTLTLLPTRLAHQGEPSTAWRFLATPELKASLDSGSYTVSAMAKDAAGHQSSSATRSFTLTSSSETSSSAPTATSSPSAAGS